MNKNKYTITASMALALLLGIGLLTACTGSFEKYNTNPDELTDEMLAWDYMGVGGFITRMQRDVIPTSDVTANEYQRAQNLSSDIFSGYMAAIGDWNGSSNNSTYNLYFGRWNDEAFKVAYVKVMSAWLQIEKRAKAENPTAFAIAEILKVQALHRITDCYGPIPYSKFGMAGFNIPYDSQEDVYAQFFKDLDAAVAVLEDFVEKTPSARPMRKYDLVYEGDFVQWIKFANSLKLRLAMRMAYVKPDEAKRLAEAAVKSKHGLLATNADNAKLNSAVGVIVNHPLKVIWFAYNDTRMGASMESFLKGYNDPRLQSYFYPAKDELATGYFGARNGVVISPRRDNYIKLSSPKVEANTPVQWMVCAEIYFLRAEGALRGWDMQGDAQELYNQGIRMSFQQYGLTDADSYIDNSTLQPAAFVDKVAFNSIALGDARLSTITIKWEPGAAFERKLERIITQKWLSMFPEGQEAWSEFRRTGYPRIFPVVANNSGGTISTEKQIRRLPFPQSEYDNNKGEIKKAVNLLGGNDHGGTRLWWDKK